MDPILSNHTMQQRTNGKGCEQSERIIPRNKGEMERDANKVKGLSRRHYLSQPWGLSSKNLSDINIKGFSSRSHRYKRVFLPITEIQKGFPVEKPKRVLDPTDLISNVRSWRAWGNLEIWQLGLPLAILASGNLQLVFSALWFQDSGFNSKTFMAIQISISINGSFSFTLWF